jgi:very-short-patch-repair endonuclease
MAKSELELMLLACLIAEDMPLPDAEEYRFASPRRFRADFAYTGPERLLIECEGATWAKGRHTRGAGYESDCGKYNLAAILGWRVLRFTRGMIESGEAVQTISQALTVAQAA